jgi:hypothetical protein
VINRKRVSIIQEVRAIVGGEAPKRLSHTGTIACLARMMMMMMMPQMTLDAQLLFHYSFEPLRGALIPGFDVNILLEFSSQARKRDIPQVHQHLSLVLSVREILSVDS